LVLANQHVQIAQNAYTVALLYLLPTDIVSRVLTRNRSSTRNQIEYRGSENGSPVAFVAETTTPRLTEDSLRDKDSSQLAQSYQTTSILPAASSRPARLGFWYQSGSNDFAFRVSLSTWFAQVIWDVQVSKATYRWKCMIRNYAYRHKNSRVFECIREGNITKLQELFASGEASPFHRNIPHGYTLQHVSEISEIHVFKC
jgi:hypothetical protein